mmetsp:Transcript_5703/g.15796  ORF Transcript_5703/g.15796 Transcript_5703/m.15796 type:complete len:221 (+) Transcript_5703:194-856(+)
MALGKASTSKTVMAIAKARQTAAQKAAAPTIAKRAMKAPYASSETSPSGVWRSLCTKWWGKAMPTHRPNRPPMIIVGATTPAGLGNDNETIVMVHLKKKQATMVQYGPSNSTDQEPSFASRSLSKSTDRSAGCGLPPSSGKPAANTVFAVTTTAIWKRSRHWQIGLATLWLTACRIPLALGLSSRRVRAKLPCSMLSTRESSLFSWDFKRQRFMAPTTLA